MYKSKISRLKSAVLSGVLATTVVAGSMSAAVKTPSITADAASFTNYAKLLQYSLYFYDANMCGDVSGTAFSWRGNCHMSDDVPGGFHDAGDHVMFGQPQGYTASTLGWAYYEFPDAFDETGQTPHLQMITDHFAKFFRDATVMSGNTVQKVLIEKGEGDTDHVYWGAPEKQGNRGRMLWTTGGAANITAQYAAALAVNYINFKNPEDLKYAEALYDFSVKNPGYYACSFYDGHWTGSEDEIAWAAAWLYKATNNSKYLSKVQDAPQSYSTHSWESVQLGAGILKGEITGDWSSAGFLSNFTTNDYCFLENWQWGSARHNCTSQFCSLVAAKANKADPSWAANQMDYITGEKAHKCGRKYSLVCGLTADSPKNPHHRAASGTNSAAKENDGVQNAYTLTGALCGGPKDAEGSTYQDKRSDYEANEVALDYNAGFVGAAAGLYHFYKTGSIDTNVPGVTKVYTGKINQDPTSSTTSSIVTTTTNNVTQGDGTTTSSVVTAKSGDGYVEYEANQEVVYKQDMGMIGWLWEDLGVGAKDKVSKVEIDISTKNGNLGKWQGAFGSSTIEAPDYWTMTDQMEEKFNGSKGTITWEVPAATSKIIQTQGKYEGMLKFGIWWIDCGTFTIDKIRVYTDGAEQPTSSSTTTTTTTQTTTTTTTTTTTQPSTLGPSPTKLGDANCDNLVNIADAVLVMQVSTNPDKYDVGKTSNSISAIGKANGDVDFNGYLSNNDALLIQKFKLGLIQSF